MTLTTFTSPTQSQDQEATSQPTRVLVGANLPTHWIAETFSFAASLTDRDALVYSLAKEGRIREPITLYEGAVLDGRLRYKAAEDHGIPCFAINFEDTQDGIAAGGSKEALDQAARNYLLQKNVVRRHYTPGQRAAIAAQLATMPQGARTDLEPSAALRNVSQSEAARLCGASVRLLQNAQRIYREGTPKERSDMEAGAPLEPIVDAIARRKKATKKLASPRVIRTADPRNSAHLLCGDLLHVLLKFPNNRFDALVSDPPYGIGMDRWDAKVPPPEAWHQILRVLKPGARCLAFGAPQTYHKLATSIEAAGFKIQDPWNIFARLGKLRPL